MEIMNIRQETTEQKLAYFTPTLSLEYTGEVFFYGSADELVFLPPGKVMPDMLKSPEALKASCAVRVYYK